MEAANVSDYEPQVQLSLAPRSNFLPSGSIAEMVKMSSKTMLDALEAMFQSVRSVASLDMQNLETCDVSVTAIRKHRWSLQLWTLCIRSHRPVHH